MTLCIKTGMKPEYDIARAFAGKEDGNTTLVLTGIQTAADLEKVVPTDCTGVMSFGLCGGLADGVEVGASFLATNLVTPDGTYQADAAWNARLFAKTRAVEVHWWSTGIFNTADSRDQRLSIFTTTGAAVIDDESYAVAVFAKDRNIPFVCLRVVSDGTKIPDLPPAARNALNTAGDADIEEVFASLAKDPAQLPSLIEIAREYSISIGELRTIAAIIGPSFGL
jgi:adenosylhomocysteine nucleosidase